MINDDESHCIFGGMYAFTESVSSDGWPLRRDRHLKLLCFVVRGNGGHSVFGKSS